MDVLIITLIIILGIFFTGAGVTTTIIIITLRRWNIRYVIRHIRNNRVQIQETKAKQVKTEFGDVWLTKKPKKYVSIPPDEAIEVNMKGKRHVEAYWRETGDVIYIHPKMNTLEAIPVTSMAQKLMFIQQYKIAQRYKTSFWETYGTPILVITPVLVLIILLFVFWGTLIEPAQAFANTMQGNLQAIQTNNALMKDTAESLKEIITKQQIIKGP